MVYMQEEKFEKKGKVHEKKKKEKGKKGTRDKKEKLPTTADEKETKSQVGYSSHRIESRLP